MAAYRQALATGAVSPDERVVLFNCATGLKYPMPDDSRRLDRHAAIDPFDRFVAVLWIVDTPLEPALEK